MVLAGAPAWADIAPVMYSGGTGIRPKDAPPEVPDRTALHTSGYLLPTGSHWSGNIGKAVVRVHYSDGLKKPQLKWLRPPWPKTKGIGAEWKYDAPAGVDTLALENFKPDWAADVEFAFKRASAEEEAALLTDLLKQRKLDRWGREYLAGLLDPASGMQLSKADRQALLMGGATSSVCLPPDRSLRSRRSRSRPLCRAARA
jgi:hypothetical protein